MERNWKQFKATIQRGENLTETGREIESLLSQRRDPEERGRYLYLLGLILAKQQLPEKALEVVEKALQIEPSLPEANFLRFKICSRKQYWTQASDSLQNCIKLDYKASYCKRMLIKVAYLGKDYVTAVNYLAVYRDEIPEKLFYILQAECLCHLRLGYEARLVFDRLFADYRLPSFIHHYLQGLLAEPAPAKYETIYEENRKFLQSRGISFDEYSSVPFKVCHFLDRELIYHCESGRFTVELSQIEASNLQFSDDDTLMIYNTDNIRVFERLEKILLEVDSANYRKRRTAIPIYIVEQDRKNWQLVMQLFDFTKLSQWYNLHFWIGCDEPELKKKLLNDSVSFPNVLYGTGLEFINQLLEKVKDEKGQLYQERLTRLEQYYLDLPTGVFQKILVITSIFNDTLFSYGKLIADYFHTRGITSLLYYELEPYYKFTRYLDLKILDEFRPDLIINLFALQEEMEGINNLDIPYLCWLLFHKTPRLNASGKYQRLVITGNQLLAEQFQDYGYAAEQISFMSLPVQAYKSKNDQILGINDLGIFADLEDIDFTLNRMTEFIFSQIITQRVYNKEIVNAVFKEVYFEIYTGQINKNFVKPADQIYQEVIAAAFTRRNILFDPKSTRFFVLVFKREFEDLIFKLVQAKWVSNDLKTLSLEIYGEGWEKDPSFDPYIRNKIDCIAAPDLYGQMVRNNKINLYIAPRLSNQSLMQPDLINGIAAGGFFLVNDLLVKEYGEIITQPFGGLLETYGSREELVEKVNYFLGHQKERLELARELQTYVLRNFSIEKAAEGLLDRAKETLKSI